MKHNWKYICRTPGYYTLKQSYIDSLNKKSRMRSKKELYRMFRRIICAAQKQAHAVDEPMEDILWDWEELRGNNWWFGFYSNLSNVRRYKSPSHPMGVRGLKKYYSKQRYSPELKARRVQEAIRAKQREESTRPPDRKPRWHNIRKKRIAESRKWHEEYAKLHPPPESVS